MVSLDSDVIHRFAAGSADWFSELYSFLPVPEDLEHPYSYTDSGSTIRNTSLGKSEVQRRRQTLSWDLIAGITVLRESFLG
jgi:hypothetical protein